MATDRDGLLTHLLLKAEAEDFLAHEADLLDARRFRDWLDLLTDDVTIWMPMARNVKSGGDAAELTRQGRDANWIDEGMDTLRRVDGVWRLARREVYLDQNVLLAKNLSVFF